MWTKIQCCFHDDRNPSAQFSDTGWFRCFACGVKGRLVDLLISLEGLSESSAQARAEEITDGRCEVVLRSTNRQRGTYDLPEEPRRDGRSDAFIRPRRSRRT